MGVLGIGLRKFEDLYDVNAVLEFSSGIRFLFLGLDLPYDVLGLLEKSMVVCVFSFSTITSQSALHVMVRQGLLLTRDTW